MASLSRKRTRFELFLKPKPPGHRRGAVRYLICHILDEVFGRFGYFLGCVGRTAGCGFEAIGEILPSFLGPAHQLVELPTERSHKIVQAYSTAPDELPGKVAGSVVDLPGVG